MPQYNSHLYEGYLAPEINIWRGAPPPNATAYDISSAHSKRLIFNILTGVQPCHVV